MNTIEVVLAVLFALLGIRSLVYWVRRPFESRDARDHALFALFVTGRVGLWLALSAVFALYASTDTQGRAFVDDVRRYDWFVLVFMALAAMQFIGGYVLGRRSPEGAGEGTPEGTAGRAAEDPATTTPEDPRAHAPE